VAGAAVALAAAVMVALVVKQRATAVNPPVSGPVAARVAASDEAMMNLALQTILADARSEAIRRCRPLVAPPVSIALSITFRTIDGGFEVERATPTGLDQHGRDAGEVATVSECIQLAYGSRRTVVAKPPFEIPAGQQFEVELDVRIEPPRSSY
jgi:hypothetical protein